MPRPSRPKELGPSPLHQVHLPQDLSQAPPSHGLVRDSTFWRRFSTAVHLSEGADLESGRRRIEDAKHGDGWLVQQQKEKRKCRVICLTTTLAVILAIVAAVLVSYYYLKVRK